MHTYILALYIAVQFSYEGGVWGVPIFHIPQFVRLIFHIPLNFGPHIPHSTNFDTPYSTFHKIDELHVETVDSIRFCIYYVEQHVFVDTYITPIDQDITNTGFSDLVKTEMPTLGH